MIPFIDLKSQYEKIKNNIDQSIQKVLDHGHYIMGPEVEELEKSLALYVGSKHCIAVSSGTDAQLIALMALNIKPDDEVIVPDFSFFATAEVVEMLGAECVFVDIDPNTYNMDPKLLEAKITKKTKAIMPVSLYGLCADFDSINAIANKYGIPVIEDAAQSFGATYRGKKSCNLTTIGATSFFPSKPLGCYGDGGACFTNDDDLALAMRQIRVHGQSKRYVHSRIGINARMDTIQAAILIEKLKIFDEEIVKREKIANFYSQKIKNLKGPPKTEETHVYAQYTLEASNRNELIEYLKEHNVPTAIHYPGTLSEQPILSHKYKNIETPHSQYASRHVFSLPMSPYLKEEDQVKIINLINQFNEKI